MTRWPIAAARGTLAALLVVGLLPAASEAAPQAASPEPGWFDETTLWDSVSGPHENYHVQGLAVTPSDTILAFTEGRHEVCDAGPRDLLLRRSTDSGQTWEPSRVVVPSVDGQSWGNPSPIVDQQTGEVFLFFGLSLQDEGNPTCSGDRQELYMVSSDDDGQTWSDPVELAELFAGNEYDWTLHGPGPGHGIQLESGRLLLQVLHRREVVGHTVPERLYGVSMIYSDDHGASWQAGEPVPVDVDYPINESRIVQRTDGTIVVNGRSAAGGTRHRITAVSTDDGTTWSKPVLDTTTGQYVAVDTGMVRYPGSPSRMLYSNPDSSRRENLTVSVSYDEGYSYRFRKTVNAGPSYYSDLAVLSDGTILLLYGRDGEVLSSPERIAIARFDLAWLTDGRDGGRAGPRLTEHEYELGTRYARTRPSWPRPKVVTDANARGGKAMRYAARRPGNYVEVPFWVPRAEEYELAVRHHRAADRGRIQVSVNGVDLPDGLLDPSLAANEAYQLYQHGTVTLSRGLHRIRFTLLGEGHLGGTTIAPDHLTLIGGGGTHELVRDPVVDDASVADFSIVSGSWGRATGQEGHPYYGVSYRSAPAGTGDRMVEWRPDVPVTDTYQVLVWYVAHPNRASDAPYTIRHAEGTTTVEVDQRGQARSLVEDRPGVWVNLGSFRFEAGTAGAVELTNDADGFVIADGVRLTRDPVPATPTGLTAEPSSVTSVALSWTGSERATGYHVERRVDGGAWEFAGEVPADQGTFTDTGLSPGVAYQHRVYAVVQTRPGRPAYGSLATEPVETTTPE